MHDFWARRYTTNSGRWLTPDPYSGSISAGDPQSWNRYAYTGNDPVKTIDPLGLAGTCNPNNCADPHQNDDLAWNWLGKPCGTIEEMPVSCSFYYAVLGTGGTTMSWAGVPWLGDQRYVPGSSSWVDRGDGMFTFSQTIGGWQSVSVDLGDTIFGIRSAGGVAAYNGLRAPDFISLNVNVGIPYLLNLVGPTVAVNIGRNGHVYIGPGVNVGKAATLVSGSVTANWMTQPNNMQGFLTKNSFSVDAGYWGGVQGAWTPGSGLAGGAGFVSPQGGGAWTYSFDLGQWFGGW
jgi:hypothetical protein